MTRIAVFYATREGHTKRISEHIAEMVRSHGVECDVIDVRENPQQIVLTGYDAVLIAASVHLGKHEPEMIGFVKKNVQMLQAIPSAFLSVSLSAAGLQRPASSDQEHARFAADVHKVLSVFFRESGWRPDRVMRVAGALLYCRYNPLVRFIMKHIARKADGHTDTSRDYDYTDWAGVDRFVTDFVGALAVRGAS
jgi:menaquinone-dependent protoporphyrinogen oxidase